MKKSIIHLLGTNILSEQDRTRVARVLNRKPGIIRWTVDMHDRERVLKVVARSSFQAGTLSECIERAGYRCYELGTIPSFENLYADTYSTQTGKELVFKPFHGSKAQHSLASVNHTLNLQECYRADSGVDQR